MKKKVTGILALVLALAMTALSGCGAAPSGGAEAQQPEEEPDTSAYLVAVEDEPDTVDFQCTSIHYTVALNVFDRLVEMTADETGEVDVRPSLAESWEVSPDGCSYTFHLRRDVSFSNGSPLTASDVGYSLKRLLTHPDSCNTDIVQEVAGAEALMNGEADELSGFTQEGDYDFTITLAQPFEAFPACMSMPGASILDQETTEEAGDRFGLDPAVTVGTGPFILKDWEAGEGMTLTANDQCWKGAPACRGLRLRFLTEAEEERQMFESGELDILDLDELGDTAEYFMHGDIYQDRLQKVQQIGITYIALNESIEPLNDVRVRKALQLALNRQALLNAVYSGRGSVENGIFPHGLKGYNPDLPEIPCDEAQAKALLEEAGYADGFDLDVSLKSSATQWEMTLMNLAVSMWEKVGVRAKVNVVEESEFMKQRKSGELACYAATWTADFNDPDNFIYTFFGTPSNTSFRSLCYADEDVMDRVCKARGIVDPDERLKEYQELERKIVQEDAAWIPLFSRQRYYVISERVGGFQTAWNGSVKTCYQFMSVQN